MFASVGTGPALTANVTKQQAVDQRQNEFWVDGSGATEHMTPNPSGLEDYVPALVGQRMEGAGGILLPVAGYGRVRFLVDLEL